MGREIIGQVPCLIFQATPLKPMEENNNIGRIWVDENDYRVLRIEWEPQSIRGYKDGGVEDPIDETRRTVICRTEYDVEKNGIRFPGKQVFREALVGPQSEKEIILEEINYFYSDYRFFMVGVEVKY